LIFNNTLEIYKIYENIVKDLELNTNLKYIKNNINTLEEFVDQTMIIHRNRFLIQTKNKCRRRKSIMSIRNIYISSLWQRSFAPYLKKNKELFLQKEKEIIDILLHVWISIPTEFIYTMEQFFVVKNE